VTLVDNNFHAPEPDERAQRGIPDERADLIGDVWT
jgi:hypothetical protein